MFSFFRKKVRLPRKAGKRAAFTGLFPVLVMGLAFVSCNHESVPGTVNAKKPSITGQPVSGTWDVSVKPTFELSVTASKSDKGTLSYQWYSTDSATDTTGGEPIDEADMAALILAKADYATNGTYYFYVAVTNTNNKATGKKTATVTSNVVTVTVTGNTGSGTPVNAQQPNITGQPAGGTWDVSEKETLELTVTAGVTDGGKLSYQWYSNATNSNTGGEVIDGAEARTFTLAKAGYTENGTYHFYVAITNTITDNQDGGNKTASTTSSVATVTVTGNTGLVITSQADMEKIGVASGWTMSASYVLANDITLTNFTPKGSESTPFTGTFNGNRKTITLTGFASAAVTANRDIGIFASVKGASASSKAAVKNLTVNSAVNVTGTAASLFQNVGLVTGYAEYAEIENITLSGNFSYTSDGRIHLGGIAGTINQTGTVIKNSTSSLAMNINPAGSGTPAPVNGGTGQHWIGGFAGLFHNGAGIEKCHNSGNLTVDNVARSGGQVYAGGIAGGSYYGMSSSNYSGYIQDSSYTGNITVSNTGNWTFAAGIAGTIVGGSSAAGVNSTRIERCFATGTVSCENTSAGFPYVGGIVAYNYYGALVSQCYFTGTVIQKGRALGQYTGCIAGYNSQAAAPTNSRIEDCWSGGKISVTTYDINNLSGPQLAGANSSRCYVIQIFSDGSYRGATGGDSSCFAINPTAKPAQSEYTAAGWNFSTVWKWDSASGYPKLQWQ